METRPRPQLASTCRKAALCLALLSATLLGSGCITLRLTNQFAADGSGTKRLVLALDSDLMSMAEMLAQDTSAGEGLGIPGLEMEPGSGDPFDDQRHQAGLIAGAQVRDYDDPVAKRKGFEVLVPFANLEEFQAVGITELFEGLEQVAVGREDGIFTLRARFNPEAADSTGQVSESSGGEASGQAIAKAMWEAMGFDVAYSVVVPGQVLDWGPQETGKLTARPDGGAEITWQRGATSEPAPELWVIWRVP